MRKTSLFFILFGCPCILFSQAKAPEDSPQLSEVQVDSILKTVELLPATIAAIQNPERAPFPRQTIDAVALAKRDGSMDMPFLLRFTPSLVVTSDAGGGVGYTSMRIRGSDQTHINVTLNGVALNDAESHQVYWVDLPDLSSSVDELNIQRGVGSSSNGPGAFGATVGMQTMQFDRNPGGKLLVAGGSFGTQRSMLKWSTGELGAGFYMEGRTSRILSDGYMDRSGSKLTSMQVGLGYQWQSGQLSYTAMLGHERTQQAWYGVPQVSLNGTPEEIWDWAANSYEYGYGADSTRILDLISRGRQHNYYRYVDQVDDYRQDHHQIHASQRWGAWDFGATVHYTAGGGYYEQYREADDLSLYGAGDLGLADTTISSGDVIRRRWLGNDFYGALIQGTRKWSSTALQFGAGSFRYVGDHFGQPIWMQYGASQLSPQHRYYDNRGEKTDRYGFVGLDRDVLGGDVRVRVEAQWRQVGYQVHGTDNDLRVLDVDTVMAFLNPKVGADWLINDQNRAFISVAQASREPVRTDYIDRATSAYPLPEHLTDVELGWEHSTSTWSIQAVAFYMRYANQLVLTGALNDTGSPIRQNVDRSYRAGLEWTQEWRPFNGFKWYGTTTLAINRIEAFDEVLFDYAEGFDPVVSVAHEGTAISFSPGFTASSVASWEFWNRISSEGLGSTASVEWSFRHVARQFLDNTSSESRSLPAYAVHDARLRWMKHRSNAGHIGVSLFLRNLLNAQYSANGWTYSYLYGGLDAMSTEVYVYPQAGRNGLVSVELTF